MHCKTNCLLMLPSCWVASCCLDLIISDSQVVWSCISLSYACLAACSCFLFDLFSKQSSAWRRHFSTPSTPIPRPLSLLPYTFILSLHPYLSTLSLHPLSLQTYLYILFLHASSWCPSSHLSCFPALQTCPPCLMYLQSNHILTLHYMLRLTSANAEGHGRHGAAAHGHPDRAAGGPLS